jgi:hypothetical protein
VELLEIIRQLRKARKRYTTIAKILNATGVPPLLGTRWHHTAVSLIAWRAGLVKRPTIKPRKPARKAFRKARRPNKVGKAKSMTGPRADTFFGPGVLKNCIVHAFAPIECFRGLIVGGKPAQKAFRKARGPNKIGKAKRTG